jgi:hypothetical protein
VIRLLKICYQICPYLFKKWPLLTGTEKTRSLLFLL